MRTTTIQFFIAFLFIITAICYAGWEREYNISYLDYGNCVIVTSTGEFVIAGTANIPGSTFDVLLIKTNEYGDTLWTKLYGGSRSDHGKYVIETADSGYLIVGDSKSFGGLWDLDDVYVVRTDVIGDTIWTRTFGEGGSNVDRGNAASLTSDGGYVVIGWSNFHTGGIYLIRLNDLGDSIWTRTFGASSEDQGNSVSETVGGGFIITGTGVGRYLIKTNGSGDTVWTKPYGGSSVKQTFDGGYIFCGGATGSFGDIDCCLLKTDIIGDSVWARTYGQTMNEYANSVIQLPDTGFVMVGIANLFGDDEDVYLIRTDLAGNLLWERKYGDFNNETGHSLAVTPDGGFIIVGTKEIISTGVKNVYLIKTDSMGYSSTYECEISRGWNLLSTPYIKPNAITDLYPVGYSPIYIWDKDSVDYVIVDTISAGTGFWIALGTDSLLQINGTTMASSIRDTLYPGWNLIGTIKERVHISNLVVMLAYIDMHAVFGWDPTTASYFEPDYLIPGKGYWVLVNDYGWFTIEP